MNRHFKYLRFSCWILPLLVFLACNPVIANTDNDHNNRLTTATLTSSDLENKAEYKAKSYSFSAGIGLNQQANGQLKAAPSASAGSSHLSDSTESVAVSGVSGGEINITDYSTQQEKTGMDAATTIAMLNREVIINDQGEAVDSQGNPTAGTLKPIFDADKIQKELNAQTQITQPFSQVAPKAVADFAKKKFEEYIAEGNFTEALQSLDAEREKQKTQAQYLSQNAYYMEVLGCEGDNDCISKYQSIRYQTEEHLHELYIKYVNGEISEERFSGGMEVALKLAAEGAGGTSR